jgi:hypothetical protein
VLFRVAGACIIVLFADDDYVVVVISQQDHTEWAVHILTLQVEFHTIGEAAQLTLNANKQVELRSPRESTINVNQQSSLKPYMSARLTSNVNWGIDYGATSAGLTFDINRQIKYRAVLNKWSIEPYSPARLTLDVNRQVEYRGVFASEVDIECQSIG